MNATATRDAIVMTWGKHRGKPVKSLPYDYLRWLSKTRDASPHLRLCADSELARRHVLRQAEHARIADRHLLLPTATPRIIHGVPLNQWEAALYVEACRAGTLRDPLPLWLPCASRLPEAWALYQDRAALDDESDTSFESERTSCERPA